MPFKINNIKVYNGGNPRFQVHRKYGKFPSNLTLGFENEIVYEPDNYRKIDDKVTDFIISNPYLYMKLEQSNEGVEINSHPFNWNWYKTLMKDSGKENFIDELCSLKSSNFYINNDCGFHIHLSRKFFSKKHLLKMVKFFYNKDNSKFLYKISQRTRAFLNEFASSRMPTYEKCIRRSGAYDYCDYKEIPYTFEQIASWGSYKFDSQMGEKGTVLNLCPRNTIEIRLFKGTTNPVLFRAYLEFALAVSLFTRDNAYNKIDINNFKKYVKKHNKHYKNLIRLIKNPRGIK